MKHKAGKAAVLCLLLAAVVLSGCAAAVDEEEEATMGYLSGGPAIDNVKHEREETATFAMG